MLLHLTLVTMDIIKKIDNKCWRGCGKKGTLLHCWWECKLVQPLWRTVWRLLKKLKIELSYDPAIPLLGIYPEKTIVWKDTCTTSSLSVDGHLGCFYVLAIETVLQWTSGCIYLFKFCFSLDICPGVGLLDHMIILFLVLKGNFILSSIMVIPLYIPTNNIGKFAFLCTLSCIYCL